MRRRKLETQAKEIDPSAELLNDTFEILDYIASDEPNLDIKVLNLGPLIRRG